MTSDLIRDALVDLCARHQAEHTELDADGFHHADHGCLICMADTPEEAADGWLDSGDPLPEEVVVTCGLRHEVTIAEHGAARLRFHRYLTCTGCGWQAHTTSAENALALAAAHENPGEL